MKVHHHFYEGRFHQLVPRALTQVSLSAQSLQRALDLERTIADVGDAKTIGIAHAGEALQHRPLALG